MSQQPTGQIWAPDRYQKNAGFVPVLGQPVLELLAPRSGERILDLGCGDGVLTLKLLESGAEVVGIDASVEQVESAVEKGVDARVMSGEEISFGPDDAETFNAVFSNAALHWMKRPEKVVAGVRRILKPGGRFVAEFGGAGNVDTLRQALRAALTRRGLDAAAVDPWYFPSPGQYATLLEAHGFIVRRMELIPRPTPLPTDVRGWLETFGESFLHAAPQQERANILDEVAEAVAPVLRTKDGSWTADYVRLRFAAVLPE